MKLADALSIAEKYRDILKEYCHRIEIAGSIRRKKEEVKDIEIVCVPKSDSLFQFAAVVDGWKRVKGSPLGKYTQRLLSEGVKLDLFMCTKSNWGLILAIRTGSSDFNINTILKRLNLNGYNMRDGDIYDKAGRRVKVEEEGNIFRLMNLAYIDPEDRL